MENKHGRLRTMVVLAAVLLGFVGVPVGLAPGLTDTQSNDVKAAGVVPAPPSSGPNVAGNFYINGYTPKQDDQYRNMQIISDGTKSTCGIKIPSILISPFRPSSISIWQEMPMD